jgi:hypothetical protein
MIQLTYAEYQCCHFQHLLKVENTRAIEDQGKRLLQNKNITTKNWLDFSKQVCQWGGKTGNRVFGQIIKNDPKVIKASFEKVKSLLENDHSPIQEVFNALKPIKGLGSYSYASKHLRFLAPERFSVFDSLIKQIIQKTYQGFSDRMLMKTYFSMCTQKAAELNREKILLGDDITDCRELAKKVLNDNKLWTPADVDMAHFAAIKKWCLVKSDEHTQPLNGMIPSDNVPPINNRETISNQDFSNYSSSMPIIYLVQNHPRDAALTLKENCDNHHNNAWVCRRHGNVDFKNNGVRGTMRYMKGEIESQGLNLESQHNWEKSKYGSTCCMSGTGYEGRLKFGSIEDSVRFLKKYFNLIACKENKQQTQSWIDQL